MTFGGESGIRTHDTVSRIHAFQACAFSHSAISPDQRTAQYSGGFPPDNSGPRPCPWALLKTADSPLDGELILRPTVVKPL